jgi:6-phosphofructokinase 1
MRYILLKTIGLVTSGGDAPGMNAAIRGIVRIAYSKNFEVLGFERGWEGLLTNTFRKLTPRSVGGILHLGGTILHTARCSEFKEDEGLKRAAANLAANNIYGLVVIGGNGSFKGALDLSKITDALIIGVPASIDNDVFGTDETIGFDSAVNTAVTEIDKIRDTAISLERIFIVEVMGRTRGFIALIVGITAGAEIVLVPEIKCENEKIITTIREFREKGKKSAIIVAAEGIGDTRHLASEIEKATGAEVRLSVLGYTQRGGNPSTRSRLLANLFANEAVELLSRGQGNCAVVLQNGKIGSIGLEESCKTKKPLDVDLLELAKTLAA